MAIQAIEMVQLAEPWPQTSLDYHLDQDSQHFLKTSQQLLQLLFSIGVIPSSYLLLLLPLLDRSFVLATFVKRSTLCTSY